MPAGLESVFKEATLKHDSLSLLLSQWVFDKELITKALQNVSTIFPHFSRHDASHSRQIIVNIERLLGEKVKYLTATDMWLLLEAAYNHDIGMVITQRQISDLDSTDFKNFVADISQNSSDPLQSFAKSWLEGSATLPSGSAAHLMVDSYKYLLGEWYRKKHSENSAKVVRNPEEEIGLSSPRNELLPKRLFNVLAAICQAHGESFEKVMQLPFSEAGMATEDCHPRYIACLLRMGDLLDIDDNRFCPVMLKMCGASLPAISHSHLEKHQAITNFRLDSERIKVEANCPSLESYEITHDWFSWLEQEYHNQSQHWPKIVPSKKLGRLPTLAPPKVKLKAPFVTLSMGKRPTFKIDNDAIFKILRTTGLYTQKSDSIREILQNAVDSTILTIWKSHKSEVEKLNPSSQKLKEIYEKYQIDFNLEDETESPGKIRLIVQDHGEGMDIEDIKRMLIAGGSSKNLEKNRIIREMPEWFRPSGHFGIGLQSIYLISKSFTVYTRSRKTHESFKLEFRSDSSNSLIITQLPNNPEPYGARFEIIVELEEFPSFMNLHGHKRKEIYYELLNDYDFTDSKTNLKNYERINILTAAADFQEGSPIKFSESSKNRACESNEFWCETEKILLSDITFQGSPFPGLTHRFRGQNIDKFHYRDSLCTGIVDFYGFYAGEFLTYNRDNLLPEAFEKAQTAIQNSILHFIEFAYDQLPLEQVGYAAAVKYLWQDEVDHGRDYKCGLDTLKLSFKHHPPCTFKEFIEKLKSKEVEYIILTQERYAEPIEGEHPLGKKCWELSSHRDIYDLIVLEATKQGLSWQSTMYGKHYANHISRWFSEDVFPLCERSVQMHFGVDKNKNFGRRLLFPCWGKYRALAIKATLKAPSTIHHTSYYKDYLVLPFSFDSRRNATKDLSEHLMGWVYDNRKKSSVTKELIEILYLDLIKDLSEKIPELFLKTNHN